MKRCPITYEEIPEKENYSHRGLRLLSPQLKGLKPLEYSAAEQRQEAVARAGKMSVQGVQLKLSAKLNIKEECFELVDQYGKYILKPQSIYYPELPENEALTMSLAAQFGLEVPVHGLVYSKDHSLTYFVKRFDRGSRHRKIAIEYFARERLGLNQVVIHNVLKEIKIVLPKWKELIGRSFLSRLMQKNYLRLLEDRCQRLRLIG